MIKDRLKALREGADMKQGPLAEALGVTQQAISRIENGTPAGAAMIKKYANFFMVSEKEIRYGPEGSEAIGAPHKLALVRVSLEQAHLWPQNSHLHTDTILSFADPGEDWYAVKVDDDSNFNSSEDSIMKGMYLAIDPYAECNHNDMVIARVHGKQNVIRQLALNGNQKILNARNPGYNSIKDDDIEIFGRVMTIFFYKKL